MAFNVKQQKGIQVNSTIVNTTTYTILRTDDILSVAYTTTGAVTITIPTALMKEKKTFTIKDAGGDSETNPITIATEGEETIDGGATYVINRGYDSITLYSDGNNWFTI